MSNQKHHCSSNKRCFFSNLRTPFLYGTIVISVILCTLEKTMPSSHTYNNYTMTSYSHKVTVSCTIYFFHIKRATTKWKTETCLVSVSEFEIKVNFVFFSCMYDFLSTVYKDWYITVYLLQDDMFSAKLTCLFKTFN